MLTCDVGQRPLRVHLRLLEVGESDLPVDQLVGELLPPQPRPAPLRLEEVGGHESIPVPADFSAPLDSPEIEMNLRLNASRSWILEWQMRRT